MGLTISNIVSSKLQNKQVAFFSAAFDSSYPSGGESLTGNMLRLTDPMTNVFFNPSYGFAFVFDPVNYKVKVYGPAPAVVIEEKHTIASNSVTLRYPAAFIMSVSQASANVGITDSGATLGQNECQPSADLASGVPPTLTFHAGLSGEVLVSYVTQAWHDVFTNLVQRETVTIAGATGALAYNALAIQSIKLVGTTSTNVAKILDKDDTAATLECAVDFTPASGNTLLTTYADDAVLAAVVTYIKKPSSGFLADNWVEEEAAITAVKGMAIGR